LYYLKIMLFGSSYEIDLLPGTIKLTGLASG
jgi:hypothetical protein